MRIRHVVLFLFAVLPMLAQGIRILPPGPGVVTPSPQQDIRSLLPAPEAHALLLISIDGMCPAYVNEADKYNLKIPNLRRILAEGAHATGVRGVLPTVTYPSHTTILTGVWPVKHGIAQNTTYDPAEKNMGGWYWYAEDIKVPTLWEAAARGGYTVGSVSWPVSVGMRAIRWLIPEYWRAITPDDLKVIKALSTPGLMAELQPSLGDYVSDLNNAVPGDWARTKYAEAIIRRKHVNFMTVHLAALDHLSHESGPFSKEALETLEETDKMVGQLDEAMKAVNQNAGICIVSDHGFAKTDHVFNPKAAFVKAGAKAALWGSGGSAFVVLTDASAKGAVEKLLKDLAADPANGIAKILSREEIAALGGTAAADFAIDMKPGFVIGGKPGGTHGYSPTHPEMRAAFMIAGPGVQKGVNAGDIDMRSIAPTLARYLGVALPSADLTPLDVLDVVEIHADTRLYRR